MALVGTISIDKSGRVVIPKALRDHLRLRAGDQLLLESEGEEITLRPVRPQPGLIRKNGIWVYSGGDASDVDIVELIDRIREERAREFFE